jgi:hypothetical protein
MDASLRWHDGNGRVSRLLARHPSEGWVPSGLGDRLEFRLDASLRSHDVRR